MPVLRKLMSKLKSHYGADKGESVYYAMENMKKGPFKNRSKFHKKKSMKGK